MQKGQWYQVRYNAKGNVIGVLDGNTSDTTYDNWTLTVGEDYVTDIDAADPNGLAYTIQHGKDSILYTESFTSAVPTMKGSTLYVNKALTQGFYVDENAKVVFIQPNDGKETIEYEVGSKEVQSFIENLNADKDGNYSYTISAILQNGAAQIVIIKDDKDATLNPGTVTPSTGSYTGTLVNDGALKFSFTTTDVATPANWSGVKVTVYGKNTTSGYVATVVADKVAGNTTISYAGSNPWTTDEVTVLSSTNDNWVYWVVATVTGTTGKVATITTAEIAG